MRQNKMGAEKISRLVWSMGLPMILSMVLQALYNVVDTMFVINMGEQGALGNLALSAAFPVQILMIAIGVGSGVGINAMLSKNLGEGNKKVVNKVAGNGIFLISVFYVLFLLFGLFLSKPYMRLMSTNETVIQMGTEYLMICCCISIGSIGFAIAERFLMATGKTLFSMLAQISGALVNIVLDYVFIYPLNMGIAGAAVATVLSQIASSIWVMCHFLRKNATLPLKLGYIKIYRPLLWGMLFLGLPPFALNLVGSGVNTLYNILFRHYAPTEAIAEREIASIGIIMTIQMLLGMPVLGIAMGMQPLLGFNTGAKNYLRVRQTFNLAAWWGGCWIFVASLLTILFKEPIFKLFCREEMAGELLTTGPSRLLLFFCGFQFVGYAIIVGQYFQAIGRGTISLTMSLSRQCFLLVPLMLLMPRLIGPIGIWWAAPISDVLSIIMAFAFHMMERRRINRLLMP